jgi:hypothetical protein
VVWRGEEARWPARFAGLSFRSIPQLSRRERGPHERWGTAFYGYNGSSLIAHHWRV